MLTMDYVHHIKFLYDEKGYSLRKIAEETGHDFKTVQKYVNQQDFNEKFEKCATVSKKIDVYKHEVMEWLLADLEMPRKQRHTGKRVYVRLKEKYGEELAISLRSVQSFVSDVKKDLQMKKEQAYIPLSHAPGQAQADFGEAIFEENGERFTGFYFNLSFPYSNGGYTQIFKGQNQECLLQAMRQIFEHLKRVPTVILFDNLSAAVIQIKKDGGRKLVEQFSRFAAHYGFQSNFCNPGKGNEKGNVEAKVGYHRRNLFVPMPVFEDVELYNRELFEQCDRDHERQHYKRKVDISKLLVDDLKAMKQLPKNPYEVHRLVQLKANGYGRIQLDTNQYSTTPDFAYEKVWVKMTHNKVAILNEDYEEIVQHQRLYGTGLESMKWTPYLHLIAKKPKSLKQTLFYQELPDPWKDFIEQQEKPRPAIELLADLMKQEDNLARATEALTATLQLGLKDADSIRLTWNRLSEPNNDIADITVPQAFIQAEQKPDLSIYDGFLTGGNPS
ncbi:IS21 family transposase [Carnobacterium sp.]|uniref:IS21 family transposase n=1 Tax=Carnobacterium sp. TaxID=48221 RepID=UPI00388F6F4B